MGEKHLNTNSKEKWDYSKFSKVDGSHPYKSQAKDGLVEYKVRHRAGGRVSVFNFDLAKEMGLLPKDHPNQMTKELEKVILDTFSIVIINEYDEINKIKFPEEEIKKNTYMATRYLQLQHPNKQGKTSGDGRSVWNGQISNRGKTWDIASNGTGATCLSPATHIENKYFQTGDPTISYGCGYSEVDEGLCTLFFSEVLHQNKLDTERVLCVIEFKKGIAINVRAHQNLLRPSHFFAPLKQSDYELLNDIFIYHKNMKVKNKKWPKEGLSREDYLELFIKEQTESFAKMAARFESDYIFCWLDWDGDNILIDGGIIDYGSIRQFGLFHHEYRFDDVERFSTNIKEQKSKARYIVQSFCQIADFLKTKKKKTLDTFASSKYLKTFDQIFENHKLELLLEKTGFTDLQVKDLLKSKKKAIKEYSEAFQYFERTKSSEGLEEVGDGINWSAVFCMRDILRELPKLLLARGESSIEDHEFIEIIKSTYATEEDIKLNSYRKNKIKQFQESYFELIKYVAKSQGLSTDKVLLNITMRSSVINRYDRVTGDSITTIVDKLLHHRPKLDAEDLDSILKQFVDYQNLNPDELKSIDEKKKHKKLTKKMFQIVREFREGL